MQIPENLRYTKDHEWVKVVDDLVLVGITNFAQKELGDIVYVEIETEGETLDEGDVFGTIEAVKAVSDLFMPVSGEVVAINEALEDAPELVNQDPYGKGWMVKIKPADITALNHLLDATTYAELIGA